MIENKSPNLPTIAEKKLEIDSTKKKIFSKLNKHKIDFDTNRLVAYNGKSVLKIPTNYEPLRAAFYVSWDPLAYFSLVKNIDKINYVIPEWFSLNNSSDSFMNTIDNRGLAIMKYYHKKIIPILSNNDGTDFNESLFEKYCATDENRKKTVQQIVNLLQYYRFQGINIDFEEISDKNKINLNLFQQQLYETLHPMGFEVGMDVPVFNDSYDYKTLQQYNDYVFAMAYDENNSVSESGPVAEQQWIEDAIDELKQEVPVNKIVLCMPTYGYNWAQDENGKSITFYEALIAAKQTNQKIIFDNNNYNLHFSYFDSINNKNHEVYFVDACSNFNTLRFADDNLLAGVSIWRLGSEDNRLWNFYNKKLDAYSVAKNKNQFEDYFKEINNTEGVNYVGEGDILDVLAEPSKGEILTEIDTSENLVAEEQYTTLPSGFVVRKFGKTNKKIVLSFDDGPDPEYTPTILKILETEKVPATFFIVGMKAQDNIPIIEEMYNNGFEIGNHTLTHINMSLASEERANFETSTTRKLIEIITGHSTILFRAPYNADSQPETQQELVPIARAKKENYYTIAESIDPTDWKVGSTEDSIYNRVFAQLQNGNIILLHDAGGDRLPTIKALPNIIHELKKRGYTFTSVAELMGKTKAEVMPIVPTRDFHAYWNLKINYWFAKTVYWFTHILTTVFIVGIVLSIFRTLFIAFFACKNYLKDKTKNQKTDSYFLPPVSVIIPAYNEELNILRTIESVLNNNYPLFEIILVDDGSTDNTLANVKKQYGTTPSISILSKQNGGKASALNRGIQVAQYDFVVCIDADTQLKKEALVNLTHFFEDETVGAVAGNVKVGNEINMLTRWQNIEYITSQNFDRRAFDELNCITVVPGAIGAFRKKAIEKAGFYTSDTLAEDCDLSIRILRCGYKIVNSSEAISFTEAPETFKMFLKQRFRWNFGVMQSFWKNRKITFRKSYKALGLIAMPNILFFQILLPLLAPFADLVLVWAIMNGKVNGVISSYFIFMIVDFISAYIAFTFQKENYTKLVWIIPQRLIYRQLMYYVLYKSIRKALKGETQGWGRLQRTGNNVLPENKKELVVT